MNTRSVHGHVSGLVQGVGFRMFTQRAARASNVTGWVRNLADGRVEFMAEGSADRVEGFLAALQRGPGGARVDEIVVEDAPSSGAQEFELRRV